MYVSIYVYLCSSIVLYITLSVHTNRLHKCAEVLLAALVNREVCSKLSLIEVWKEDKKCNYLHKLSRVGR